MIYQKGQNMLKQFFSANHDFQFKDSGICHDFIGKDFFLVALLWDSCTKKMYKKAIFQTFPEGLENSPFIKIQNIQ